MNYLIAPLVFLLLIGNAYAQTPVEVDGQTTALWNFDNDIVNDVVDDAASPLNGQSVGADNVAMPTLGIEFGLARRFGAIDSFISFGQAQGSKLDFEGDTDLTIEAMIYLENEAPSYHVIFDNGQVQFMVVGGKLAGFVRQEGGFIGTVAENTLNLNQAYRVSYLITQGRMTLFVDGQSVSSLMIPGPIAPPAYSSLNSFIGGNIFGQFFPGYIDDVRVSNVPRLDGLAPVVTLISPIPGAPTVEANPVFSIQLSDNIGVDATKTKVWLNNVLQTGLTSTETSITGAMDQALRSDIVNVVKVEVYDLSENKTVENFNIIYSPNTGGFEYTTDSHTLALYHMNDFSRGTFLDESGNGRHAFTTLNQTNEVLPTDGIFGNGRLLSRSGELRAPSMSIPDQAFSFETWIKPITSTTNEVVFSNGQFNIERFSSGYLRVTITTKLTSHIFETPVSLLPQGEMHHLAITWDGNGDSSSNLKIYRDGIIAMTFDAPVQCDFDPIPSLVAIGTNFEGIMDEMRISSIARVAFNVPTIKEPGIHFNNLANLSSTLVKRPELNVDLNSFAGISVANINIYLNGTDVTTSSGLVITPTTINGTIDEDLMPGLNQVEVRYADEDGNHAQRTTNVFYVENLGGNPNEANENTALLLNFDSGSVVDDSGHNYEFFISGTGTYPDGVFSKAFASATITTPESVIDLGERSFTFEGFFKAASTGQTTAAILSVFNNSGFNLGVSVNRTTGTVEIAGDTPVGDFSGIAVSALPVDQEWHHLALVVDDARDYANIILFVDGQIKYTADFNCACDFSSPMRFSSAHSNWVTSDEIVLTKEAKYSFNLNKDSKPVAVSLNPAPESTIGSLGDPIEFVLSDPDGMSTQVSLKVNGQLEESLTLDQSGFEATLSGTLQHLVTGVNTFELVYADNLNNAQKQVFNVYFIESEAPTEYVTDSSTMMLFHMNESVGSTLADSSGNAHDLPVSGSNTYGSEGLFGTTSIRMGGYVYTNVPAIMGLTSYTAETWVKTVEPSRSYTIFYVGGVSLYISNGTLTLNKSTGSAALTIPNAVTAEETGWNHFALIVDNERSEPTALILKNGNVIGKYEITGTEMNAATDGFRLMHSASYNNLIEEFRLSNRARYNLVSTFE